MTLPSLTEDAKRLCQQLLRIDTTNPPGNERAAAELVAGALREVGFEPELLEGAPQRTNLVVRHRGSGKLPPLLLTAHLDVVEADPTKWQVPPFSGRGARRLPVGARRDRHEEHGGDVHGDPAPARRDRDPARARRDLRGSRRRGGRLRSRFAIPRRAAPREGRGRVRDRRVRRVLAPPRRRDLLSDPGRGEGLLLGQGTDHRRARPRLDATPRQRRDQARRRLSPRSAAPRCRCTPRTTSRTSSTPCARASRR